MGEEEDQEKSGFCTRLQRRSDPAATGHCGMASQVRAALFTYDENRWTFHARAEQNITKLSKRIFFLGLGSDVMVVPGVLSRGEGSGRSSCRRRL